MTSEFWFGDGRVRSSVKPRAATFDAKIPLADADWSDVVRKTTTDTPSGEVRENWKNESLGWFQPGWLGGLVAMIRQRLVIGSAGDGCEGAAGGSRRSGAGLGSQSLIVDYFIDVVEQSIAPSPTPLHPQSVTRA